MGSFGGQRPRGSRDVTGTEVLGEVLPEFFGWANQFVAVLNHF